MQNAHFSLNRIQSIAAIISILMVTIYIWVYASSPFPELVNVLILNSLTPLAALFCSIILTLTLRFFAPGEEPRIIWLFYAACIWLWTVAEAYWGYLYTTVGEVPVLSLADALWVCGYLTFTISIVRQYRLVTFGQKKHLGWIAAGVWLLALTVTAIWVFSAKGITNNLENYILYFYPIADITVGLAAIYLVYTFRGSTLAGPWLTILAFVISDILYIGLTTSGVYDWEMQGVNLSLFVDTIYLVAYIIVGWGALQQYLLLYSGSQTIPNSENTP